LYREGLAAGAYVIRAVLFDQPVVPLTAGEREPGPRPVVLAEAVSAPFVLRHPGVLSPVEAGLQGTATFAVAKLTSARLIPGALADEYIKPFGPVRGPDEKERYCQTYEAQPPAAGTFEVCGPAQGAPADFEVHGSVTYAPRTLPYVDAVRAAETAAAAHYHSRIRLSKAFIKYELEYGPSTGALVFKLVEWTYRPAERCWILVIGPLKEQPYRSDTLGDYVIVRVDDSGKACVVKSSKLGTIPMETHLAAMDCP
jgi:hypothetical protein